MKKPNRFIMLGVTIDVYSPNRSTQQVYGAEKNAEIFHFKDVAHYSSQNEGKNLKMVPQQNIHS